MDLADLKRKSVRGGAVTLVSQAIRIGIQLTSTVVLARLLSPGDYGVMAMVMAVTGFAGLFRDLGLSSAAIQKKDLTRAQQSNLFWINVAMGALLTIIVAACSPLVAWFYGKPELTTITLALSASFLIGSFGTQHGARLVREMQFARQAVATISGAIVALIITITLAWKGFSYWSLVWGNLAGGLTTSLLLFALSPFRPGRPSKGSGIRDMLKFGADATAFSFVNYFSRNLDNILIGRVWGSEALGLYSRAYALLMFPLNAIRGPISSVAFPAMSCLQHDSEAYRTYYRRLILLLSCLTMPITAYLYVSSHALVMMVLGEQWIGVSSIFQILSVTAFVQTQLSMIGMVQLTLGRSRKYLKMGIVGAIITSLGFCVGVFWGPKGVATAYAITTYLRLVPTLLWAFNNTPLHLRDFFESLYSPCLASIISGIFCYSVLNEVANQHLLAQLSIAAGAFCLMYILVLYSHPSGRRNLKWFYGIGLSLMR